MVMKSLKEYFASAIPVLPRCAQARKLGKINHFSASMIRRTEFAPKLKRPLKTPWEQNSIEQIQYSGIRTL
jgi:hypothetical protein